MWIVRLALRRPYTFIVASILILILGIFAIVRTPVDIFPNIDIPVVAVVWGYGGLSPEQMATRITFNFERFLTTTVTDIEHIESQSYNGRSVVKIFFHPGVNIASAFAQITAASQVIVRQLPQGTTPPLVLIYNASTVPIVQFALGGLPKSDLNDIAGNFLRTQLVTIPGVAVPGAYGGKQRQIQVDLNGDELQSKGLSPADVTAAIANQNLILPSGTIKIGHFEYEVETNGSPQTVAELSNLPIKNVNGSTIWLNPDSGITYSLATEAPQYALDELQDLNDIPISGSSDTTRQILANVASITPGAEMALVSHYNIQSVIDIYGNVNGRDLGGVAADMSTILDAAKKSLVKGSQIAVRGQIETMKSSFIGLLSGLAFSILLVYLLIVVNFQSWLDPFIILMALPAGLAGIVWMLFLTGTAISVPALTGAIMCMGVATANSILVISFSKDRFEEGKSPAQAALEAGYTRFRPVLMTALAMIIGMLPMALGLGEGGEENAPLGRAVIGGLLFATVATLFFVPVVFSFIHGWRRQDSAETDSRTVA